jgi:hypothetical protein
MDVVTLDMVVDPLGALPAVAGLCALPMTGKPLPTIGNDYNAAEPYREFMASELTG